MSRRHAAEKREVVPDPKFGNAVVSKFMNAVMYDGKKSVAEKIVYGAMDVMETKGGNAVELVEKALENQKKKTRVGGQSLEVKKAKEEEAIMEKVLAWLQDGKDVRKGNWGTKEVSLTKFSYFDLSPFHDDKGP